MPLKRFQTHSWTQDSTVLPSYMGARQNDAALIHLFPPDLDADRACQSPFFSFASFGPYGYVSLAPMTMLSTHRC